MNNANLRVRGMPTTKSAPERCLKHSVGNCCTTTVQQFAPQKQAKQIVKIIARGRITSASDSDGHHRIQAPTRCFCNRLTMWRNFNEKYGQHKHLQVRGRRDLGEMHCRQNSVQRSAISISVSGKSTSILNRAVGPCCLKRTRPKSNGNNKKHFYGYRKDAMCDKRVVACGGWDSEFRAQYRRSTVQKRKPLCPSTVHPLGYTLRV